MRFGQSPRESVVKSIIPGTTSVTKPRQKLAVCVDYLGRRRTSSSSLSTASMQKVNHVRLCAMAFGFVGCAYCTAFLSCLHFTATYSDISENKFSLVTQ